MPKAAAVEDHLNDLKAHRYLGRAGYRLAKRTGLNNWYVPKESSFTTTTFGECFRLWKRFGQIHRFGTARFSGAAES
jgi:predicted ATPase